MYRYSEIIVSLTCTPSDVRKRKYNVCGTGSKKKKKKKSVIAV